MKDKDKNKEQLLKELKTLQTRLSELQRLGVEHKRAETRFRALLEAAPDPIIIVDRLGRIMLANAQTERLFGYDRDELLGEPVEVLIPERFRKPHIGHRNDYFSMPRIRPMGVCVDLAARRKDGIEFPVEISLSPLETEEGTLTISVVRDITDRKRAEGELRIQKGLLEEKVREMDDFIHVVSHDLKEPLRGIEAFAGFLQEDYASLLDEQGRRYIHFVKSSAVRMKDLIHDLLALASISRKGPVLQRTDLNQVLAHVEHDLGFAIQQKKAEIRLLSPLPEVVVDATQIGEVFKNLLSNAIKFNASIPPKVEIAFREEGEGYFFSVKDNGIGIDPRYTERIFSLFERLHPQEEFEGTGAGLAICKKVIEGFGGKIGVESRPGEGSVFFFTLPRRAAERDVKERPEKERPSSDEAQSRHS